MLASGSNLVRLWHSSRSRLISSARHWLSVSSVCLQIRSFETFPGTSSSSRRSLNQTYIHSSARVSFPGTRTKARPDPSIFVPRRRQLPTTAPVCHTNVIVAETIVFSPLVPPPPRGAHLPGQRAKIQHSNRHLSSADPYLRVRAKFVCRLKSRLDLKFWLISNQDHQPQPHCSVEQIQDRQPC